MNINRLLNPATNTSSLVDDAACVPDIFGGETPSRRAIRPRSKFIELVTTSHRDANSMNPQGHHMTVIDGPMLDELRSGVNDLDESSSYRVASSSLPHENLIFPRTTPSPSEASRSSITSASSVGKSDLVCRLPIGSISLNSRDSSCASHGMAPMRPSESISLHVALTLKSRCSAEALQGFKSLRSQREVQTSKVPLITVITSN